MHTLLCQLKRRVEEASEAANAPAPPFDEYARLGVTPLHVHRSKTAHKRAIFTLGKELAEVIANGDLSNADLVASRMNAYAGRFEKTRVL